MSVDKFRKKTESGVVNKLSTLVDPVINVTVLITRLLCWGYGVYTEGSSVDN